MQTATIDKRPAVSETRKASRKDAEVVVRCTAELAECTCPEWCERDHERD